MSYEETLAEIERALQPICYEEWWQVERALEEITRSQHVNCASLAVNGPSSVINTIISALDAQLTAQLNEIMHHIDFRNMEGVWHGLHHLVINTQTDEQLKIRVFNIAKSELATALGVGKEGLANSPLYKKIYEAEYGHLGGEPYGCLVGDFYFDHSTEDVNILTEIAMLASANHSPFLSAALPGIFQLASWAELNNPRDLSKTLSAVDYSAWTALREIAESRYLTLLVPRFLARLPYGSQTVSTGDFNFEEDTGQGDPQCYVWANSCYALAVNINRSFSQYGWCAAIQGVEKGGVLESSIAHIITDNQQGVSRIGPVEISIGMRRAKQIVGIGFCPLLSYKRTDFAVFLDVQSIYKLVDDDSDEYDISVDRHKIQLAYLLTASRFAQYLKVIARDTFYRKKFRKTTEVQIYLNEWIHKYVSENEYISTESAAQRPLSYAKISVEFVHDNFLAVHLGVKPRYLFGTMAAPIELDLILPSYCF